jgi:hypothetical protein
MVLSRVLWRLERNILMSELDDCSRLYSYTYTEGDVTWALNQWRDIRESQSVYLAYNARFQTGSKAFISPTE